MRRRKLLVALATLAVVAVAGGCGVVARFSTNQG